MIEQRAHAVKDVHRARLGALAVMAALAIVAFSLLLGAMVLLHKPPAVPVTPSTAAASPAVATGASILYGDPQALALAERSADVLFGIAASQSGQVDVLVRTGDGTLPRSAFRARLSSGVALRPTPCGSGCFRLDAGTLEGVPERLALTVARPGKPDATARFVLPAEPPTSGDTLYRKVIARMGALHSVHVSETLTAGLGLVVHTEYDLQAPDRIRFDTSQGQRVVIIGQRRYDDENGTWVTSSFPETRSPSFIWEGASRARLLGETTLDGEPVQVLSLFLPHRDFPAWFRLYVLPDGRVLEADMLGPSHFMVNSFSGFDEPVDIEAPQ